MSKPYRICPNCGSHLDPGERCSCQRDHSRCASGAPATVRHLGADETNRESHVISQQPLRRPSVEAQYPHD